MCLRSSLGLECLCDSEVTFMSLEARGISCSPTVVIALSLLVFSPLFLFRASGPLGQVRGFDADHNGLCNYISKGCRGFFSG